MSESKYRVTKGLAQIITTGEPVYVLGFEGEYAIVTRPVATQNGIEHKEERFLLEQLETRNSQVKREFKLRNYVRALEEEAQQKMYQLPAPTAKELQKIIDNKQHN